MSDAVHENFVLAFALPIILLWAAHAGFRVGRLGHDRKHRRVRIQFRLRDVFVVVTLVAVFFAVALRLGATKFSEQALVATALVWLGLLFMALIVLTTQKPPDQSEDP